MTLRRTRKAILHPKRGSEQGQGHAQDRVRMIEEVNDIRHLIALSGKLSREANQLPDNIPEINRLIFTIAAAYDSDYIALDQRQRTELGKILRLNLYTAASPYPEAHASLNDVSQQVAAVLKQEDINIAATILSQRQKIMDEIGMRVAPAPAANESVQPCSSRALPENYYYPIVGDVVYYRNRNNIEQSFVVSAIDITDREKRRPTYLCDLVVLSGNQSFDAVDSRAVDHRWWERGAKEESASLSLPAPEDKLSALTKAIADVMLEERRATVTGNVREAYRAHNQRHKLIKELEAAKASETKT